MHIRTTRILLTSLAAMAMVTAHAGALATPPGGPTTDQAQAEKQFGIEQGKVLEITARHPRNANADDHLEFVLSDHEIPAGWTTIKQVNASHTTHFVYMVKVPDAQADMTREEYLDGTPKAFQEAWDPYFAGEYDVGGFFDNLIPALPEWWNEAIPSGGPGFLSSGGTGWTTMNLAPGTYFIECYVMDSEGTFHNTHGMLEKLVVTEQPADTTEPEADLQVRLSSVNGLSFEAEAIQPGLKTIEVVFEDNIVYGHGLGHDVHLVRLDNGTTIDEVNTWINYLDVGADGFYGDRGALVSGGDKADPETFLGGVQALFADEGKGETYPRTAHFHVNLTPGHYALVSEVPNPMQPDPDNPEVSLLKEFSVTPWASLTGAWYDPDTNGQGWNFYAAPAGLFGYFYGYDSSGNPLWLITEDPVDKIEPGQPVTYDLLQGTGGTFTNPVPPEDLQLWGEVTLTFEDCQEATAEISGVDGIETHNLVRITETAGSPDCAL